MILEKSLDTSDFRENYSASRAATRGHRNARRRNAGKCFDQTYHCVTGRKADVFFKEY